MLSSKREEMINAGEDVEKRDPSCTGGGKTGTDTMENSLEVPQKVKSRTSI